MRATEKREAIIHTVGQLRERIINGGERGFDVELLAIIDAISRQYHQELTRFAKENELLVMDNTYMQLRLKGEMEKCNSKR